MKRHLSKTFTLALTLSILLALLSAQVVLAAGGTIDTTFNSGGTGANGPVWSTALLPDGDILIGGEFTSYNGITTPTGIARLNGDGTLDTDTTFNADTTGIGGVAYPTVRSIVVQTMGAQTLILLGGDFKTYNGSDAPDYILRIDLNGALDVTFNTVGTGAGNVVYSIALQSGKILVAGGLLAYNGDALASDGILRLDENGALDTTFNYGTGRGASSIVSSIAVQPDGYIVAGGFFTTYADGGTIPKGSSSRYVLRLTPDGVRDQTFNWNSGTGVWNIGIGGLPTHCSVPSVRTVALEEFSGEIKILVGGCFATYDTDANAPNDILRLNANGTLDTDFNYAGAGASVVSGYHTLNSILVRPNGRIVIGGYFTAYNGDAGAPDHLLQLKPDGLLDASFNSGTGFESINDEILSLAVQPSGGSTFLAGGYASFYNAVSIPQNFVRLGSSSPTVTISQADTQPDPASASPIHFTVIFSAPVSGFGDAAVDVVLSGTAAPDTAVVTEIAPNDGTTYQVAVSGMTSSGRVIASVPAGAAEDVDGNLSLASTPLDDRVTYDITSPSLTINQRGSQADPSRSTPIYFSVLFSENVTGLTGSDFDFTGSTAPGTLTAMVTGSGKGYTISVTGMTGPGLVVVSLPAGMVTDAAGNENTVSTSTDNQVAYDNTRPTVTINQGASQPDPTKVASIEFTVIFSEPVTGFAAADVLITGTAPGVKVVNFSGSETTYTVTVTGMTNSGTVIAQVLTNAAQDAAGNLSRASTSTNNTVIYDITPPSVFINQHALQADPANGASFYFSVVFNENVTGLTSSDIDFTGSTAPETLTAKVTGSGKGYTITVTGMTGPGLVVVALPAGMVTDAAGNENTVSTSTDNQVAYDNTRPTVTINQGASQPDRTKTASIEFTVIFSEPVTGFAAADVLITGTAPGVKVVNFSGSETTYTVTVTGMTDLGTVIAQIASNAAQDAAGNLSRASTSTDNTVAYDITPPSVTINQHALQADPAHGNAIYFSVIFSENVTGLTGSDIDFTGSTAPGTLTAKVTGSGKGYTITVIGMTGSGDVVVSLPAGMVTDAAGNGNTISASTDHLVVYIK